MAERVTANTLIIIFTAIIVIFSVIVLIQQAEANIMFWILRPSESTAMDIVSKFTALGGTSGKVITDYSNITSNVHYYIHNEGKVVCVISVKKVEGALPLKTVNCFSTPFEVNIPEQATTEGETGFLLCFSKDYDTDDKPQTLDIKAWWGDESLGCV